MRIVQKFMVHSGCTDVHDGTPNLFLLHSLPQELFSTEGCSINEDIERRLRWSIPGLGFPLIEHNVTDLM